MYFNWLAPVWILGRYKTYIMQWVHLSKRLFCFQHSLSVTYKDGNLIFSTYWLHYGFDYHLFCNVFLTYTRTNMPLYVWLYPQSPLFLPYRHIFRYSKRPTLLVVSMSHFGLRKDRSISDGGSKKGTWLIPVSLWNKPSFNLSFPD